MKILCLILLMPSKLKCICSSNCYYRLLPYHLYRLMSRRCFLKIVSLQDSGLWLQLSVRHCITRERPWNQSHNLKKKKNLRKTHVWSIVFIPLLVCFCSLRTLTFSYSLNLLIWSCNSQLNFWLHPPVFENWNVIYLFIRHYFCRT